jgi:hypothetical protein
LQGFSDTCRTQSISSSHQQATRFFRILSCDALLRTHLILSRAFHRAGTHRMTTPFLKPIELPTSVSLFCHTLLLLAFSRRYKSRWIIPFVDTDKYIFVLHQISQTAHHGFTIYTILLLAAVACHCLGKSIATEDEDQASSEEQQLSLRELSNLLLQKRSICSIATSR